MITRFRRSKSVEAQKFKDRETDLHLSALLSNLRAIHLGAIARLNLGPRRVVHDLSCRSLVACYGGPLAPIDWPQYLGCKQEWIAVRLPRYVFLPESFWN